MPLPGCLLACCSPFCRRPRDCASGRPARRRPSRLPATRPARCRAASGPACCSACRPAGSFPACCSGHLRQLAGALRLRLHLRKHILMASRNLSSRLFFCSTPAAGWRTAGLPCSVRRLLPSPLRCRAASPGFLARPVESDLVAFPGSCRSWLGWSRELSTSGIALCPRASRAAGSRLSASCLKSTCPSVERSGERGAFFSLQRLSRRVRSAHRLVDDASERWPQIEPVAQPVASANRLEATSSSAAAA
jgi:hypothetical protein